MSTAVEMREQMSESRLTPKPPVFVVGSARSGTTLLYHMLLSSGGFAKLFGEPAVFDLIVLRFGDLSHRRNRERAVRSWLGKKTHAASGLAAGAIRQKLLEECHSNSEFLSAVMSEVARQQQVERWAVWGPDNLLYLETIKAQIPEAKFIHMIRDGRDVAVSMNQERFVRPLPGDASRSLLVAGLHWQWKVKEGRRQAAALGADYLEVRFEDLLADPQRQLDRVSRLIEHPLDYEMLRKAPVGSFQSTNSSFVDVDAGLAYQPVRRWQKRLTAEQVAQLEACIGDTLEELGYARASADCGRSDFQIGRMKAVYPRFFSAKQWLKQQPWAGRMVAIDRL
jgi:hypothetical protein